MMREAAIFDSLLPNDTIDNQRSWIASKPVYFYNYNKPPEGGYGKWLSINTPKYLGFRFSVAGIKKYGWMKIEKTDKLEITEIAYER